MKSNLSKQFSINGFVGPIKLYEPDEAKTILHEIRLGNQIRDKVIHDNDVNYDRHFDIPALRKHICHPKVISSLREIVGNDILCWRTEFFPKFPGGRGTEWHQVANYGYATGKPMLVSSLGPEDDLLDLTVWTAFTDATIENGCMKFLPGSHKHLYYDESKPVFSGRDKDYVSVEADTSFYGYEFEEFKIDPEWNPDLQNEVSLEMKAGECVIFSARCVHGSHPNITKRNIRFAISSRYAPAHVRVYPDWTKFRAHGGEFDLKDYGCVLVSGEDRYGHNTLRSIDNHNKSFEFKE